MLNNMQISTMVGTIRNMIHRIEQRGLTINTRKCSSIDLHNLTLKLLNFWSRSHCISNSITSTIKKRKFFAASRERYIFYESLWDEDY